ncbi:MAG: ADP-polyphosphate phosphotransferase [Bdellovibrionales bacterium]
MKNIELSKFQVREGQKVTLTQWPTKIKEVYRSKSHYQALLADHVSQLSELQRLLYASNEHAVLLIFQAMDGAGKDGVIRHVMSGVNPQGCQVFSYKHPSPTELAHDFLWRTTRDLPERGRIGIFNRSYYEEVLIVRVHPEILKAQNLPPRAVGQKHLWEDRYRSINGLESHLVHNGTVILKFFLHLSKDEQCRRFIDRIDQPEKNWKFSEADIVERGQWKDYMSAYEKCIAATSTKSAPWYIVPADDKENARIIVSKVIVEKMKSLNMKYPKLSPDQKKSLRSIRRRLEREL